MWHLAAETVHNSLAIEFLSVQNLRAVAIQQPSLFSCFQQYSQRPHVSTDSAHRGVMRHRDATPDGQWFASFRSVRAMLNYQRISARSQVYLPKATPETPAHRAATPGTGLAGSPTDPDSPIEPSSPSPGYVTG